MVGIGKEEDEVLNIIHLVFEESLSNSLIQ